MPKHRRKGCRISNKPLFYSEEHLRKKFSNYLLDLFRRAKEKEQFKKRREINIEIKDHDSVEMLLAALNYRRVLIVEKKRKAWQYCDCIIALDELPLLGSFVEIEGPSDEKICEVQKNLAMAHLSHIPRSYASLMKEKLRTNDKRTTE